MRNALNARNNRLPRAERLHHVGVEVAMLAWLMILTAILTVVIAVSVTKR